MKLLTSKESGVGKERDKKGEGPEGHTAGFPLETVRYCLPRRGMKEKSRKNGHRGKDQDLDPVL